MRSSLARLALGSPRPLAMPVGVYAGLALTGAGVREVVADPEAQAAAARALHERFDTPVLMTAMDLSAEAEAFGCEVHTPEDEIPSVVGRKAPTLAAIEALRVPAPGEARTHVHLESARRLVASSGGVPVLGELLGPFSLAARIFGVSEALEATIAEPETMLRLLEKTTAFLGRYAQAFRAAGAAGVVMAEPAAGLLSPPAVARFSAAFVRQIAAAVQDETFAIVLHNCGARLAHLAPTLESGAEIYHFGAPMDLPEALRRAQGRAIVCGNLDPTSVFHDGPAGTVAAETARLLAATDGCAGFVLSSGCDLPPGTPLENLEAFFRAARGEWPSAVPAPPRPRRPSAP